MPKTQKRAFCLSTEWQKHKKELISLKKLVSLYWIIKIKTRKSCCLNNRGSILLNDITQEGRTYLLLILLNCKNAQNCIYWLKILLMIKSFKIITRYCLKNLSSMLGNKKTTKRRKYLLEKLLKILLNDRTTWNEVILQPEEPYFLFWMIRT